MRPTATRGPGRPPKFDRSPTEFGRWLDASGMSVEAFAKRAGISIACVYRYRRGEQIPTLPVADKIIKMADGKLNLGSFAVDK